jgi:membrane protease YdiL (CAAX protease family)
VTRLATRGALLELSLAALALGLGAIIGTAPTATLRWSATGTFVGLAATLPLLAGFALLSRATMAPLRRVREDLDKLVALVFVDATVLDLACVSIAAGFGEELLFRGLVQEWLTSAAGPVPGLAAASVLFGLAHPISAAYVVIAAAVGAYLGWLWQVTGDLATPIVTHAVYDFVVLWILTRRR